MVHASPYATARAQVASGTAVGGRTLSTAAPVPPATHTRAGDPRWHLSHRADPRACALADRHYNRQSVGSPQFVPPGRCVVLWMPGAFWVTSWPFAEYTKHAWAGAWVCSAFRNERPDLYLSSDLIREAVAATRYVFGDPPALGMVTFVDPSKTRRKRDPGWCYLRAGFVRCGETQGGLPALQLLPDAMPAALAPLDAQLALEVA